MSRLLLVRHGETEWNSSRRLQGRTDIALSETGRAQVSWVRDAVRAHRPDRVVVSPLLRAVQSCAVLGYEPDDVDDRWQEADLGEWTGQESALIAARGDGHYARWRAGELTPPLGESFTDLSERVGKALDDLLTAGGTSLVVTHGGPIRAACAQLVGLEPRHVVPVDPGSLTVVDRTPCRPAALRAYNTTGLPLTGDPPD